jgi:hypothetical protein
MQINALTTDFVMGFASGAAFVCFIAFWRWCRKQMGAFVRPQTVRMSTKETPAQVMLGSIAAFALLGAFVVLGLLVAFQQIPFAL